MTASQAKKELMRRALEIDPTVHVGKDGVDENLNNEVVQQLKKRRLIKVKVLNNAEADTKTVAEEIAAATGSVIVDVRGGVIILTDKRTWDSQCQKKSDN
ncbi:MAG: YhbY family RNA-binding protein [Methanomethylophilus sp.]|jgi:RNA-binding protein|nr:YhbY family RNA-binding protein [Methanomethylophilus sp.]MEE3363162.1 YhbY family RNA-binding protein [Methanomethylophilus sp.]MEE3478208.1 YhbY family RNA-binding protein [Methanomethylophilus sp.]